MVMFPGLSSNPTHTRLVRKAYVIPHIHFSIAVASIVLNYCNMWILTKLITAISKIPSYPVMVKCDMYSGSMTSVSLITLGARA